MVYGKLLGAKLIKAPNVLNKDGKQYINPPEELYLEYGYLPLEYTTIPDVKEGCHLVQSWIDMGDRLIQKWNYEKDTEIVIPSNEPKIKMVSQLDYDSIPIKENDVLYFIIEQ